MHTRWQHQACRAGDACISRSCRFCRHVTGGLVCTREAHRSRPQVRPQDLSCRIIVREVFFGAWWPVAQWQLSCERLPCSSQFRGVVESSCRAMPVAGLLSCGRCGRYGGVSLCFWCRVVVKNTLYSIPFDTATSKVPKRPSSATPFGSYNPVLNPQTSRTEASDRFSGVPYESAGSTKRLVPYVRAAAGVAGP